MTTLPFKLAVTPAPTQVLLTIMGKSADADPEATRNAHNMAAGSDQGVAAARSFGDLSHSVFVPQDVDGDDNLLFIDYWNSLEGLMTFFSDPQVQAGGAMVFARRDPVVWASEPGLPRVNLPAPTGRTDRYVGIVRGPVTSRDDAGQKLNDAMRGGLNMARAKGLMTREWYFRADQPNSPEVIGLDVWFDAAGMQASYSDPEQMAPFNAVFSGRPASGVWKKPAGAWVEW